MNYLFFDIECANCYNGKGKIYSFGYLLTDSDFNVLIPPTDLLINPNCKFDFYVKKHILAYDVNFVKTHPDFKQRYDIIKQLMCDKNTVCFGYGIQNDLGFLKYECKRYQLPQIKAKVLDIQNAIPLVLDRPARKLDIEYTELVGEETGAHRSDVDAMRTMKIAKLLAQKSNKKIHLLFEE